MTPTQEQLDIINAGQESTNLKIVAGAGAAKTSSLVMLSDTLVQPSLYLAFNKAMADEASSKFAGYVEVKTTHALAYGYTGVALRPKLSRPQGMYKNVCGTASEVAKYFKVAAIKHGETTLTANAIGMAIRNTVNSFEYSKDAHVDHKHIDHSVLRVFGKTTSDSVLREFRAVVVKHAKALWTLRTMLSSNILARHDTYLKMFQLSKPKLLDFEVIYVDESQDLNDCILDIILNQSHAKVVFVGDNYQQIYSWRGSVNALDKVQYKTLPLTQSFRYGPDVATIANAVLGVHHVDGWKELKTLVTTKQEDVNPSAVRTILFRTNSALLFSALDLIAEGKKVNLEIDVRDFLLLLQSAIALFREQMKDVKHEDLLGYSNWHAFKKTAKEEGGPLSRVVQMVDSGDVYRVIGFLSEHKNYDNPDIILTTAHKAKGREWDIVELAEDFPPIYTSKGEYVGLNDAERNLLYVAATRAKKRLIVNGTVEDIVARAEYK